MNSCNSAYQSFRRMKILQIRKWRAEERNNDKKWRINLLRGEWLVVRRKGTVSHGNNDFVMKREGEEGDEKVTLRKTSRASCLCRNSKRKSHLITRVKRCGSRKQLNQDVNYNTQFTVFICLNKNFTFGNFLKNKL